MCLLIFLLWEEWGLAVYIGYIEFNSCISHSRKLTPSIDKLFYVDKSEDAFWLNTKYLGFMDMKSNCIYQICLNIFRLRKKIKSFKCLFQKLWMFRKKGKSGSLFGSRHYPPAFVQGLIKRPDNGWKAFWEKGDIWFSSRLVHHPHRYQFTYY